MNIETYSGDLQGLQADLLVLILDSQSAAFEVGEAFQARLDEIRTGFAEKKISREVSFDPAEGDVKTVVVYSTDMEKAFGLWENVKTFTQRALRLGLETGRQRVVIALNGPGGAELVAKAVEGALIGTYAFETYRQEKRKLLDNATLVLWTAGGEGEENEIAYARCVAEGVNTARDLIHEPANVVTPERLAEKAQELASTFGFEVEVWDEKKLADEKYIGLTAVGGGAHNPPRLIRLTYTPENPASEHHLVLLGKGVTFDTGGISIKPADKMYMMRGDMAGAAAVLGTMQALGQLKPSIKVTALVVSAENTPGPDAMRPGDILTYNNGKSVHVDNTDAEGRLILADGLIHAGKLGATHVVDVATLTGSCARALGPSFTGLMGNNRTLVNAITRAGGNTGESYWKLPLPSEYKELLKTPFADLNNIGGIDAGAITAGLFLQEFVPAGVHWAHLDIAGTFWKQKPWKYYTEGPSGVAVKSLIDLAVHWKDHLQK